MKGGGVKHLGWFVFVSDRLPLGSSSFSGVDKNQYPHPVQAFPS